MPDHRLTSNSALVEVPLAERWNGHELAGTAGPWPRESALSGVACPAAALCIAVGHHETGSFSYTTLAEAWNGTSWAVLPSSSSPNLASVSCAAPSSCTAIGSTLTGTRKEPLAVHWNGTAWAVQHPPAPPRTTESLFSDVSCPAVTACEAVGFFHQRPKGGGFRDRTLIETGP